MTKQDPNHAAQPQEPRPDATNLLSQATQLSTTLQLLEKSEVLKFIRLTNVKIPTMVDIVPYGILMNINLTTLCTQFIICFCLIWK